MTLTQANALVDLYLDIVKNELVLNIMLFLKEKFPEHVEQKNMYEVNIFVDHKIDDTIHSARNKVSSFKIKGGGAFKKLLDTHGPLNNGHIKEAKNQCRQRLQYTIDNGDISEEVLKVLLSEMNEVAANACQRSAVTFKNEIKKIYGL